MWRPIFRTSIIDANIYNASVPVRCVNSKPAPLETIGHNIIEPYQKVDKKYSFAKNLFFGKIDANIFRYPELQNPVRLESSVLPLRQYFETNVNSCDIDSESQISSKIIDDLKVFGLFGQRIPSEYGGLALSALEYLSMMEPITSDYSIADTLFGHDALGIQGILLRGTEEQKRKYLPMLAKGDWIATLCLCENDFGSDIHSIACRATLSDDGLQWKLNGRKKWVINASNSELFIVLASVGIEDRLGKKQDTYGVFIVEKSFGGITLGEPGKKLGKKGSSMCEVTFNNTPVPVENVLGQIGSGFHILMEILSCSEYLGGCLMAASLKNLTMKLAADVSEKRKTGDLHQDHQLPQMILAELLCTEYAVDSMCHITAGIVDRHDNSDYSLESAMIKVFSSESLWRAVNKCHFGKFPLADLERIFRDSRTTTFPLTGNDGSRLFIALAGLQHAGMSLHETVKKLRNPLFYPGFLFKKIMERRDHAYDKPKLELQIHNLVHPALQAPAEQLEYAAQRLKYVTELLLGRYGAEVVEYDADLCRLADIAINVFAMTAVVARASHSYSAGLQNADRELLMAKVFCSKAWRGVKSTVQDIVGGPMVTSDLNHKKIAQKVFKSKGYFFQHALAQNF